MALTAKPKECSILWVGNFSETAKVHIHLYPQQKWEYSFANGKVRLEYKCISLLIPKEDFEKYWKVVE